jgi:uncharacterized repeat protein (TIGR01451 family)
MASDLQLSKTVSDPTPNVGDTIIFTVTLANSGPSNATAVTVTDLLPAGLTFVSATPSQGTYVSGSGLWTVGTVNSGAAPTLALQATVASATAQTNTATISHSDQFDPNTGNNTASAAVTPQQADLALSKTVSNANPNVGGTITFTVTLTNGGPNPATAVTITDLLPAGLTFVSAAPNQGTYSNATGLWTVGTVNPGTPATLAIQATVTAATTQTNTATISHSDQFDPNAANNSASVTETPKVADLAVTKTVNNATPTPGTVITFTVTLTNNGPDAATTVTVTDLLTASLQFQSATPSQGTYNSTTGLWTVGTVNSGTSVTLSLQAKANGMSTKTNTATVSHSDEFDPTAANNSATVTVTPM